MTDKPDFTTIANGLLTNVHDLVDWGIVGGHTTDDKLRLTISARQEAAKELIGKGLSQRQAAKVLGVGKSTIQDDLAGNRPKGGRKLATAEPPKPVAQNGPAKKAAPTFAEIAERDAFRDLNDFLRSSVNRIREMPDVETALNGADARQRGVIEDRAERIALFANGVLEAATVRRMADEATAPNELAKEAAAQLRNPPKAGPDADAKPARSRKIIG
jgi:hypothetical protein